MIHRSRFFQLMRSNGRLFGRAAAIAALVAILLLPVWAGPAQAAITQTTVAGGIDTVRKNSYSTPVVSPGANRLLLLWVAVGDVPQAVATVSVSGLGLTWVKVEDVVFGSNDDYRLLLFRAMGTPVSGSLTITPAGGEFVDYCAWSLSEYDGVDTSGSDGSGAIVQSKTNTGSNKSSLNVSFNPTQPGACHALASGFSVSAPQDITPRTGWAEIHEFKKTEPPSTSSFETQYRLTAGSDADASASWSGSYACAGIAVEIRPAEECETCRTATDCDQGGECQTASCVDTLCAYTDDAATNCTSGGECQDAFCEQDKSCGYSDNDANCVPAGCQSGGTCTGGVCSYSANNAACTGVVGCQDAVCNVSDGSCSYPPNNGKCTDNGPDGCLAGTCNVNGGCEYTPNNGACDDGNVCTTNTCQSDGSCSVTANPSGGDNCCSSDTDCGEGEVCSSDYTCEDEGGMPIPPIMPSQPQAQAVPTLDELGLVLLAVLMLGIGAWFVGRRRKNA